MATVESPSEFDIGRKNSKLREIPVTVISDPDIEPLKFEDSSKMRRTHRTRNPQPQAPVENLIYYQPAPQPQYPMYTGFPPNYWQPQMFVAASAPIIAKELGPLLVGETPRTVRTYWNNDFTQLPRNTYRAHKHDRDREPLRYSNNYNPRETFRTNPEYKTSPSPSYRIRDFEDDERPLSKHYYYDESGDFVQGGPPPKEKDSGSVIRPQSRHYFYGPDGELLSGPPKGLKIKPHPGFTSRIPKANYAATPAPAFSTDDEDIKWPKAYTVVGELQFGHLRDINYELTTENITTLPKSIRDELYSVYGHISRCEVMIMAHNGKYTIQVKVPTDAKVTLAKPVRGTSVWDPTKADEDDDDEDMNQLLKEWKRRIREKDKPSYENKQDDFNFMMKKFMNDLKMNDHSKNRPPSFDAQRKPKNLQFDQDSPYQSPYHSGADLQNFNN